MPSESSPDSSPEQAFARKLAAQELAKYCQEFSRWRRTQRGGAAADQSFVRRGNSKPLPVKESDPPVSPTSV